MGHAVPVIYGLREFAAAGRQNPPVDAKHKMIVEQAVSNDVVDMGLLKQTAEPARDSWRRENRCCCRYNKGYFKNEDIEACEAAGLTP